MPQGNATVDSTRGAKQHSVQSTAVQSQDPIQIRCSLSVSCMNLMLFISRPSCQRVCIACAVHILSLLVQACKRHKQYL